MKNIILSMVAKISRMEADSKQLTAQVEAQSLLLSAVFLTLGKNGGPQETIESVNKAINSVLDSADEMLKSDATILFEQFQALIELTRLIDKADPELDAEALSAMNGVTPDSGI
ncbi:anti-adapter protein IraP [Rahnella sp. C60]|uniref:Anti-adapter protein IraP n=1 Tax=Rahnella perminowiae TaxID=2816244 RepID=A0ABS6KXR5_9GAMM|nr:MULTISPECIES: anti-adapter protein IraP [Rahnella]UJD89218.1 anti-adapter protein IraP [Rahnella aquatilis]MBU9809038.1 anti-adapter protein IraP [Rahnella perminowiae]MBU9817753.1 anti-adapter protein IraP [Rahnella perminowiae]MBU9824924.1 anti-adapter protein IraP [Rahnella perminowiae]MBU9834372.1 anti-adapter protein IraP [Rahnella perminowiae]